MVAQNGAPFGNREIALYPDTFNYWRSPDSIIKRTTTRTDGSFELELDSTILYNLFVVDSASASGVCVRSIGHHTRLGIVRLDTLGSIRATVHYPDTVRYRPPVLVYNPGTPLSSKVPERDSVFTIDKVPPGIYQLSLKANLPTSGCPPGQDCGIGGVKPDSGTALQATVLRGTPAILTIPSDSIGGLR
jgi:hypothetical protein